MTREIEIILSNILSINLVKSSPENVKFGKYIITFKATYNFVTVSKFLLTKQGELQTKGEKFYRDLWINPARSKHRIKITNLT